MVKCLPVAGASSPVADKNPALAGVVVPIVVLFNVPAVETRVEKAPALGTDCPIVTLFKTPVAVGLIVSVPLICGLIVTSELGVIDTSPDVVKFDALTFTLFIVPPPVGLIFTVPVPVGLIVIVASTPELIKFPVLRIELNDPIPVTVGLVTLIAALGILSPSP